MPVVSGLRLGFNLIRLAFGNKGTVGLVVALPLCLAIAFACSASKGPSSSTARFTGAGQSASARAAVDADVVRLVVSAQTRDGAFSEVVGVLSPGVDVRSTFFSLLALAESGGIPDRVKQRTSTWLRDFLTTDGWVKASGSIENGGLEDIDVAILLYKYSKVLGVGPGVAGIDETKLADAASSSLGPDWDAARVSRMAWAEEILNSLPEPKATLRAMLATRVAEALPTLRPSDVRDAVAMAQFPDGVSLPPSTKAAIANTLRDSVAQAASHPGPWDEQYLALAALGLVDRTTSDKAFRLLGSTGAPRYWGSVGAVDAYLLLAAPPSAAPQDWGGAASWRTALREALLSREGPRGGFTAPVVSRPSLSATGAAVVALHYARGDREIANRAEAIERMLCTQPEASARDSNLGIAIARHAIAIAGLPCAAPKATAPSGSRPIDTWLYAIASNVLLSKADCPQAIGEPSVDRVVLVLSALALREEARTAHVRRCGGESLVSSVSAGSVLELYSLLALRIMLAVPTDVTAVTEILDSFRSGIGYGSPEGARLTDTCQAMVVREMMAKGELLPVVCGF